MALGLSGRVSVIEGSISLLSQMSDRLKYLRPTMGSLMDYFCSGGQFERLEYPRRCRILMKDGLPFPESWRQAVMENKTGIGDDEADILAGLGDTLGCTDLDTQLSAINCARDLLGVKLENAREAEKKFGKLYRTMGVLGGLALFIILL